jgi:DNA-directed RNA polymerase subunit RPC12/RpoP
MSEREMKTLQQHNEELSARYYVLNSNDPRGNGIECPECKSELFDSAPMITLTSMPPQKNIHCESCGYKGYRVA